jgi:hypothetical protein
MHHKAKKFYFNKSKNWEFFLTVSQKNWNFLEMFWKKFGDGRHHKTAR